jgi:rhamnogalacturonan endolyase
MKINILIVLIFIVLHTISIKAQDPRERTYFYPVLKPNHEQKPPVEGWAKTRMAEKLNRGLTAVQIAPDKIYLSWRLLVDDPSGIAFNL